MTDTFETSERPGNLPPRRQDAPVLSVLDGSVPVTHDAAHAVVVQRPAAVAAIREAMFAEFDRLHGSRQRGRHLRLVISEGSTQDLDG